MPSEHKTGDTKREGIRASGASLDVCGSSVGRQTARKRQHSEFLGGSRAARPVFGSWPAAAARGRRQGDSGYRREQGHKDVGT